MFLTNFSTISFAKPRVISFLLNDDCAIRDIIAPSSSLTLVFIFFAIYSTTSSDISTLSLSSLFFTIETLVSKSGF